jgi:hypothetical protein
VSPVAQPLVHANPAPPAITEQSGVAPPHTVPHAPQLPGSERSVSQPLLESPSQSPKPATHDVPHCTPSHVALAFGRVGQGMHVVAPHDVTALFETHAPAQRWYPLLHSNPHVPASQVALAFVGAGQGSHEVPHESGASLAAQSVPHAW